MLYNETTKKALATHKNAVEKYNGVIETVQAECERLYQTRKQTIELIECVEDFLNSITDTPQKFEPNLQLIKIEHRKFRQTEDYAAAEAEKEALILGGGVAVGVAGRIAFVNMAPTATMWVATTFGKASTGIPISSLWGAAKNNAALAWLGGGAKSMGGGGIAAGQARLALAGPIGLCIAGVVITGSLIVLASENKKIAEQAIEEANEVRIAEEKLNKTCADISRIHSETEELLGCVCEHFKSLELLKDCNYVDMSKDEQLQLGSLVNNTLALAEMLNKVVE